MPSLGDDELQILFDLLKPIEPQLRDAYLRAVAIALRRYKPEQRGVGLISRVARELQREFLRAR
jgi:hypothetical protein